MRRSRGEDLSEDGYLRAERKVKEMIHGEVNVSGTVICPACGDGRLTYLVDHEGRIYIECSSLGCI